MNDKYIVYFVSKTKKKMVKYIEKQLELQGLDELVPSYGNILTVLYDNDGKMTMKEIGDLLGKDKSTITALVSKLMAKGYVEKQKSTTDRRKTYIRLTQKSIDIKDSFDAISKNVHETAYKGLTKEEKKVFLDVLKKINMNFDI
ncbi:MAG: MarR family transcriptional regulator [Tissierellales bacterium]|jgi:DNA-binding MarR family transcriptional regulator|nr:MarR family transcriptional regulator [Tissierellales bacterium]